MAYFVRIYNQSEDLSLYLQHEFNNFERYLEERFKITEYHVAPLNPYNGMIVLADGTDWNPGSGGGFYGYYNGSWTFLG